MKMNIELPQILSVFRRIGISFSTMFKYPTHPFGLRVNHNFTGKFNVSVFYDILCPDSKAVHSTMKTLFEEYKQKISFKIYLFPLPYHRASFSTTKVAQYFEVGEQNEKKLLLINSFFDEKNSLLKDFSNSSILNISDNDLRIKLVNALSKLGFDEEEVLKALSDVAAEDRTRQEWKYCCYKSVFGTPSFFINNVFVDAASWDLSTWRNNLNKLCQNSKL
eukprot:maker-scaffold_53-snap-gene-1.4-mRNA-1 protein AED:0.00 eAED:0.00 QI:72/1/1/1/0.33/0/4/837/219